MENEWGNFSTSLWDLMYNTWTILARYYLKKLFYHYIYTYIINIIRKLFTKLFYIMLFVFFFFFSQTRMRYIYFNLANKTPRQRLLLSFSSINFVKHVSAYVLNCYYMLFVGCYLFTKILVSARNILMIIITTYLFGKIYHKIKNCFLHKLKRYCLIPNRKLNFFYEENKIKTQL